MRLINKPISKNVHHYGSENVDCSMFNCFVGVRCRKIDESLITKGVL